MSTTTVGVEEEYHVVDAETLELRAEPKVLDRAVELLGERATHEISLTQLEVSTPVCESLDDLRRALVRLRRLASAAATDEGCEIVAAGTHPTSQLEALRLTPDERYLELWERWGALALEQGIVGCHVHVGIPDLETAVRAIGQIQPWLPVLLALTGSSPFWQGRDTGYSSFRTQWYARWPVTGPVTPFDSVADYEALVAGLVEAGVVDDASFLYWDVRPSQRFPTLEVRVADVCPEVDDAVLHAALARSLVRTSVSNVDAGLLPGATRPELLRGARWRAARYGLEEQLVDPTSSRLRPAHDVVQRLVDHLRPDLEGHEEWGEVRDLLDSAVRRGTSASEQRRVFAATGHLHDVTRHLVATTRGGSTS